MCANQDIYFPLFQLVQQFGHAVLATHAVYIHPGYTGLRKYLLCFFLYFFRAKRFADQLVTAALRTRMCYCCFEAAVVAMHFICALVISERYGAILALRCPSADRAQLERRIPPPVLKQYHLLALLQRFQHGLF